MTTTASLLMPDFGTQSLVASVIGAEATATTYLINCPLGTDGNDCGVYNQTLTLGPWADATPASGAPTTGLFDMYVSMQDAGSDGLGFEFSVHCSMTRTVAEECTTINIGGNNDGTPTATLSGEEELESAGLATMTHYPVAVTAGLEKLEAVTEGGAATTGTEEGEASSTASQSQSSGAADKDSAAGSRLGAVHFGGVLGAVALVGAVSNWI